MGNATKHEAIGSAPQRRARAAGLRAWVSLLSLASLLSGVLTACSINRATGRLQLTTISESEEIALGEQNDAEVVDALGLYEEGELPALVQRVGATLAAQSERPGLPWTFRVLDDPTVNAFALPGGFVYATRGLLVHLSSEHELAAVLGHEIGHVTARHGVVQLRKSRVAAASVGVFRVIDPGLRHVGGIAASTAGLALLKHSRDDEYEADTLALRYTGRAGWEPAATVRVFDLLTGVSRAEQSERIPDWLSTHPDPELRRTRVKEMTSGEPPEPEPEFLAQLNGVVYGQDPRDGFIVERTFVHPRRGFRVDLPEDWEASHEGPQLLAASEDESAILILTPATAESAQAALEDFFSEGPFEQGEQWEGTVGGFQVASAGLSIETSDGVLQGLLAFIEYDEDGLFAMMALAPTDTWEANSEAIGQCFASFRKAERVLREIEPMRVRILELKAERSLADLHEERPSVVELPRLALLNGADPQAPLPAGTRIKWVQGLAPGT